MSDTVLADLLGQPWRVQKSRQTVVGRAHFLACLGGRDSDNCTGVEAGTWAVGRVAAEGEGGGGDGATSRGPNCGINTHL